MIRKIGVVLLMLLLVGCQSNIKTVENKKQLMSDFVETLKKGELEKLHQFLNVDTKVSIPNPDKIDEKAFIQSIFSGLEVIVDSQENQDIAVVKNYDMNQLIKEAKSSIITIEGKDTTRNKLSEDEKKTEYLKRIEEVKKTLSKTETKLQIKFVEEGKQLKLDFEDKETLKLFNASLGIK